MFEGAASDYFYQTGRMFDKLCTKTV